MMVVIVVVVVVVIAGIRCVRPSTDRVAPLFPMDINGAFEDRETRDDS